MEAVRIGSSWLFFNDDIDVELVIEMQRLAVMDIPMETNPRIQVNHAELTISRPPNTCVMTAEAIEMARMDQKTNVLLSSEESRVATTCIIVVCRPDGYVSMVAALHELETLEAFFMGFISF